jgi:hypothetical protein
VQDVVFAQGRNQVRHAFRYTDRLGLGRAVVMDAVLADLSPNLPLPSPPPDNSPFIGFVRISGIDLRYHAFPFSEEWVNAGSIIPLLRSPRARTGTSRR